MQCRAVARRLAAGSLTVLGDLAQATSPWSPADWPQTLAGLGRPDTVVRPLTRGYRVPGEVLDFANRLLPSIAPGPAGGDGGPLRAGVAAVWPVTALAEPLAEVVARAGRDTGLDRRRLRRRGRGRGGRRCCRRPGCRRAALTDDGEEAARVAVVPATLAKGLEFDAVVVVEPAAIVAAEPRGLHRLYVVLTRAVSSLVVLHRGDLPAAARALGRRPMRSDACVTARLGGAGDCGPAR